jgi:hypothetical protein
MVLLSLWRSQLELTSCRVEARINPTYGFGRFGGQDRRCPLPDFQTVTIFLQLLQNELYSQSNRKY